MSADATLMALEPAAIDQLMAMAAGTAEPIRPARLLQSCLTLHLSAGEPLNLSQLKALLRIDTVAGHDQTSICVSASPWLAVRGASWVIK